MNKIKSFIENLKKYLFLYIVVWLLMVILLVAPVTYTITQAHNTGINWIQGIMTNLIDNFFEFPIKNVFDNTYINDFINGIKYFSVAYVAVIIVSIFKTLPKGGFHNIEHGSSDWCVQGEQYKVLSKKEGLLLAKDNYLPLTKPGNHNVLIVGRFWCW